MARKVPVLAGGGQCGTTAVSRKIQALTGQLEALAQAKVAPRDYKINTWFNPYPERTLSGEAAKQPSRTN